MGRYGMAGRFYRKAGYITLQDVPDPNREYVESFENLVGGMNRFDLDFKLKGHESPFIQNLSWHNGVLCSRWGQAQIWKLAKSALNCAPFLFHGWMLAHIDGGIGAVKLVTNGVENERELGAQIIDHLDSLPMTPGTFFRYRENVYYKTKGAYVCIQWVESEGAIVSSQLVGTSVADMTVGNDNVYVPVVQMNTDAATGAGDIYQPENRLTPKKTVMFNTATGVTEYHLPEIYKNISMVGYEVKVDNAKIELDQYSVDSVNGILRFDQGYQPPAGKNRLAFTFVKNTQDSQNAFNSVMDATVAAVFGGAQELCVIMGGCEAQPNAYFWSGHTGLVMDPTYFPFSQYNLAGENSDPITALGRQQNMLVIFQPNATGRATFGTEEINGRVQVTMNYTRINAEIGCDLPGSLQLVQNNLVWCNRRHGVCRLKDSSAAYENNIVVISRKINGDYRHPGLIKELQGVENAQVHSTDTGRKYILVFGNDAYEWNYELSEYDNPSWFYHKGIRGIGFVPQDGDRLFEILSNGAVAEFQPCFADFGEPIEKIYTFPPRNFGSYDRLKNICSMLFTTRGDANTNTQVIYTCDYAHRADPTNLVSSSWALVPRNLTRRDLSCAPFSRVFRRSPGYHNIRHLGVRLYNCEAGIDLSIVAAQIFYTYRGRQR